MLHKTDVMSEKEQRDTMPYKSLFTRKRRVAGKCRKAWLMRQSLIFCEDISRGKKTVLISGLER